MRLNPKSFAVLTLAAVAFIALFVAACSSSDVKEEDIDQANERITALEQQTAKSQILAWRTAIRAEDLHGLDEEINAADEIDDGWISAATRSRQATASVSWPDDMQAAATELLATFATLEDSLSHGDLEAAQTAATNAHDQYHDLEHDASPYIAGETPAAHDDETEASPDASEAAH